MLHQVPSSIQFVNTIRTNWTNVESISSCWATIIMACISLSKLTYVMDKMQPYIDLPQDIQQLPTTTQKTIVNLVIKSKIAMDPNGMRYYVTNIK